MANPIYESMQSKENNPFNMIANLKNQIQQLKATGIDPNKKIQEMLNSGQITQQDYNNAVQRANQIQMIFGNRR